MATKKSKKAKKSKQEAIKKPTEEKPQVKTVSKEVKVDEKKKKEKISQKERPRSKKKHTKIQVWKLYKIENGKIKRTNNSCPRCGPGIFVATFKNRKYCGRCGWSEITKEEKLKTSA